MTPRYNSMKPLFLNLFRWVPEYNNPNPRVVRRFHALALINGREYNKLPWINVWIRRME